MYKIFTRVIYKRILSYESVITSRCYFVQNDFARTWFSRDSNDFRGILIPGTVQPAGRRMEATVIMRESLYVACFSSFHCRGPPGARVGIRDSIERESESVRETFGEDVECPLGCG